MAFPDWSSIGWVTRSARKCSVWGCSSGVGEILERLQPLCGTRHTLIQPGPHVLAQEAFAAEPQVSADLPASVVIQEHGTRFRVHFEQGHKTGFFCDQRDNRRQLASYCAGRSVLDLCCYTGGFAIQAKRLGQAAEVIGVDLDEQPLRLARQNAALNQVQVKFVQADVFPFMRDMLRGGRQFDVVVLDPPKLVRSRAEFELGSRKYFDLNRLAMQLVRPGGILLTCTCSGLMPRRRIPAPGVRRVAAGGAAGRRGRGRTGTGYASHIARPGQDRRRRRSSGGRPLPGDGVPERGLGLPLVAST